MDFMMGIIISPVILSQFEIILFPKQERLDAIPGLKL